MISLSCSSEKCIVKVFKVEIKDGRIREDNASFHLRVIGSVLAGNDGQFPIVVPEQSDFCVYGSTAVIEAACNDLEWFRAYTPYPVVQYQLEGNYFFVFDMVLKLLYAFAGEGIGGHGKVYRTSLFNNVHYQSDKVKVAKAVIMCVYFRVNHTDCSSKGFVHIRNKFCRLWGIFGKGNWLKFTCFFCGWFIYGWYSSLRQWCRFRD